MGLLTAPLTLAREPLRLTLRVWEVGLATAAEAARIGGELLDGDHPEEPPVVSEPWPPPPQPEEEQAEFDNAEFDNGWSAGADATEVVEAEVELTDAPPAVPDELVPDHVDEEAVLVAETAEEGAAEGAGAELHVEPPWERYDQMTAADIRDRLALATPAEAAAVELYEASRRNRRSVMDAATRVLGTS